MKKETAHSTHNAKFLKLQFIGKIIFFGTLAAILYHFVYQGMMLKKPYPYNTFSFLASDRFNDFFNLINFCKNSNPYFEPSYLGTSNYLPLCNFFFLVFSFIDKNISLFFFLAIPTAIMYWYAYKNLKIENFKMNVHKYAFIFILFSYPVILCIDRANIEIFVALFLMLFFYFYQKKQTNLSILFLVIAAAMKIYPIIFVLLFVSEKKYRETAVAIISMVLLTILPIFIQHGGFLNNLYFIMNGFEINLHTPSFHSAFDDNNNFMIQGSSLFSALKILDIKMKLHLAHMFGKYVVLVAIITLITLLYVVFVEKSTWKKSTLLMALIIALPHISFDYKLLHVLPCVFLYINEPENEHNRKLNYTAVSIIFGLLLIPKNYIYYKGIVSTTSAQNDIPIATLLNPLLLLVLMYLIIKSEMKDTTKEMIRQSFMEHITAIKKSALYLTPVALLAIPYVVFSGKAKKDISGYETAYLSAQKKLEANQKNEALRDLQQAFLFKSFRFQLPLQIAGLYNELGKPDSAIIYYRKTLEIYPQCQEAEIGIISVDVNRYNAAGIETLNNKKFEEAEKLLGQSLAAFLKMPYNPSNQGFLIGLYSNISVCQINLQKWTEAKQTMAQITALDPNSEFVKNNTNYINQMQAQPQTPTLK